MPQPGSFGGSWVTFLPWVRVPPLTATMGPFLFLQHVYSPARRWEGAGYGQHPGRWTHLPPVLYQLQLQLIAQDYQTSLKCNLHHPPWHFAACWHIVATTSKKRSSCCHLAKSLAAVCGLEMQPSSAILLSQSNGSPAEKKQSRHIPPGSIHSYSFLTSSMCRFQEPCSRPWFSNINIYSCISCCLIRTSKAPFGMPSSPKKLSLTCQLAF